ncbi:MAG: hypothetical protein ABH914_04710 [Candidatus Omnitrophota bacterium]
MAYVGMAKSDLYELFSGFQEKGYYKKEDNQEWITFAASNPREPADTATFYLLNGKVIEWNK